MNDLLKDLGEDRRAKFGWFKKKTKKQNSSPNLFILWKRAPSAGGRLSIHKTSRWRRHLLPPPPRCQSLADIKTGPRTKERHGQSDKMRLFLPSVTASCPTQCRDNGKRRRKNNLHLFLTDAACSALRRLSPPNGNGALVARNKVTQVKCTLWKPNKRKVMPGSAALMVPLDGRTDGRSGLSSRCFLFFYFLKLLWSRLVRCGSSLPYSFFFSTACGLVR